MSSQSENYPSLDCSVCEMTYAEKLAFYVSAKRATATQIHKIENGNFVPYWIGRLKGKNVTMNAECKHRTREQAVEDARRFREACRSELNNA